METPFLFLLLSEHQYRQLEGRHKPFPKLKGDAIEISVLWKLMRYSIRRSMHDNTIHLVFEEPVSTIFLSMSATKARGGT